MIAADKIRNNFSIFQAEVNLGSIELQLAPIAGGQYGRSSLETAVSGTLHRVLWVKATTQILAPTMRGATAELTYRKNIQSKQQKL